MRRAKMDVAAASTGAAATSISDTARGDSNESDLGPKECDSADSANLTAMLKEDTDKVARVEVAPAGSKCQRQSSYRRRRRHK